MNTNLFEFISVSNSDMEVTLVVGGDDKNVSIVTTCDSVSPLVEDAICELLNDLFISPNSLVALLAHYPDTYNSLRDYFTGDADSK